MHACTPGRGDFARRWSDDQSARCRRGAARLEFCRLRPLLREELAAARAEEQQQLGGQGGAFLR